MVLNEYTKKIIRRLALLFTVIGGLSLAFGFYTGDMAFVFMGSLMLLTSITSYAVGSTPGNEEES